MKRNRIIINLLAALIWMSMYVYMPTLPAYARLLGAGAAVIGTIGGAYGVMQVVLRIPLGAAFDKLRRDRLILFIGFAFVALSSVLFIFAKTPGMLIFARGVAGIGAAWSIVLMTAYAKYNDENKQVKSQGVLSFTSSAGKTVGALLCGVVAQAFGYMETFYLSLVISVIGLALVPCMKHIEFEQKKPPSVRAVFQMLKNKSLILFSVLGLLAQALGFSIPTVFAAYAAENLGASSMELGLLLVIYCAAQAMSALFVGTRPYRKIGGINTLIITFVLAAISCLPMFYTTSVGMIFAMQILSGLSFGAAFGTLSGMVLMTVDKEKRGMATGLTQSVAGVGAFLGPLIVGAVMEYISFDLSFIAMAILMAVAAAVCAVLIPRKYAWMT